MKLKGIAGYIVGSVSLFILGIVAGYHEGAPGSAVVLSVALQAGLIPWILGVVLVVLARRVYRITWGEAIHTGGACWWGTPLLLLSHLPAVGEWPLAVTVAGFVFAVLFVAVPFARLRQIVCSELENRVYLGAISATFAAGLFFMLQTCLYHDALHTYGYLRSMWMDGDLDFYDEFVLHNAYFMYVPHPSEPVFYSGMCAALAPFFAFGHLLAVLLAGVPGVFSDGYSWPYKLMACLGNVIAGFGVMILLYRLCRRFYGGFASAMATLLTFWGGSLAFYTFVWPLYPHMFSLLAVLVFVTFWLATWNGRTRSQWFVWGVILGMCVWIRPQGALLTAIVGCELLRTTGGFRFDIRLAVMGAVLFALGALAGFSPQLALWYKSTGKLVVDVYGGVGDEMYWLRPHLLYLLFSPHKGFFAWAPVFLFALPGAFLFCRRHRTVFTALGFVFLLNVYLIASYEYPEGRASFGSRYLIDTVPFLSLCLGAFIEWIRQRVPPGIIVAAGAVFVYTALSMVVMYHLEMIPHDMYRPTFGQLAGLVTNEVPRRISDFIFLARINENVFARRFLSALVRGDLAGWLVCGAQWLVACGLACGTAVLGYAAYRWYCSRRVTTSVCMIGVAGLLVALGLAMKGPVQGRRVYPMLKVSNLRQEALPSLDSREFRVDSAKPTVEITNKCGFAATWVDFTGMLVTDDAIPGGSEVARVTVDYTDGRQQVFPVVKGKDVDDYELYRDANPSATIRRTAMRGRAVHHWLDRASDGTYFYGTGYWWRSLFERTQQIKSVRFDYMAKSGALVVTGVCLAGEDNQGM